MARPLSETLLERVVDARLEIGLRSVVVDTQAAADVQDFETGALLDQLRVDARGFVQRALHDSNVGNLTAQMEMQQLETILHSVGLQLLEAFPDLGNRQAEFRPVPA